MFEFFYFYDVVVDVLDGQVRGFFLLGFGKFVQYGFGQVDYCDFGIQFGCLDGVLIVVNIGKQDVIVGMYGFDVQYGGFVLVDVFVVVKVVQEIVDWINVFVFVVYDECCLFLFFVMLLLLLLLLV